MLVTMIPHFSEGLVVCAPVLSPAIGRDRDITALMLDGVVPE